MANNNFIDANNINYIFFSNQNSLSLYYNLKDKRNMKRVNVITYIDIAFCLVILPAMVMLLPIDRWLETNPQFVSLLLVWLYVTYFIYRRYTIPMLVGGNKHTVAAIVIIVASFLLTYLLTETPMEMSYHSHLRRVANEAAGRRAPFLKMHQQGVLFLYMLTITFSSVVTLLAELYRHTIEKQQILYEKNRAELSLYKAQINPHFLFNTLNSLLGLVIAKSDKAEDAFLQFTTLMRYMCDNSTQSRVSLDTEMDYINQYIELHRFRLNDKTTINFDFASDDNSIGCNIAPMLLITFVENALKYGSSPHQESVINITATVKDCELTFSTSNLIFDHAKRGNRLGIGIDNCRKRLDLEYNKRHSLAIHESKSNYDLTLTIKLDRVCVQ